jgi:hypothetical protein
LSGQVEDFGREIITVLRNGEVVAIRDMRAAPMTAEHAKSYANLGIRTFFMMPIMKNRQLLSVMASHQTMPRA